MLGSVMGIVGGLMCALSIYHQNFWLLVCSTPFLGMFTGFGEFSRYAAADACDNKQQKSKAISIVISGGIVAAFAGPSIASYSNQYLLSIAPYFGPYLAASVLCALSLVLYSQLKIDNKFKPKEGNNKFSSLEVIRNPVFLVATSVAAIGYLVMAAMMDAFPFTMLDHSMHFSDTATVLQWHMLAMFGPSYLTARYINKFGVSVAIFTGILFNLVGLLSALQGVMFVNFWICLFMIGLGWNLMYLAGTDMITNMSDKERPRAEGLSSLVIMASFALSAPLAAVILVNRQFVLKAYLPAVTVSD